MDIMGLILIGHLFKDTHVYADMGIFCTREVYSYYDIMFAKTRRNRSTLIMDGCPRAGATLSSSKVRV